MDRLAGTTQCVALERAVWCRVSASLWDAGRGGKAALCGHLKKTDDEYWRQPIDATSDHPSAAIASSFGSAGIGGPAGQGTGTRSLCIRSLCIRGPEIRGTDKGIVGQGG